MSSGSRFWNVSTEFISHFRPAGLLNNDSLFLPVLAFVIDSRLVTDSEMYQLKGLFLRLTRHVATSASPRQHPNSRPPARLMHFIKLLVH
jgi:hypothetical protein